MDSERLPEKSESFSQQLHGRVAVIEKRDWELWVLALAMVAILAIGYFVVIFPAVFMNQRTIFIQAQISSQLLLGQLILVLLFVFYLVHKHMQIRTLRAESMMESVNFQLAQSQLMLDPLTQVLNRATLEQILSKEIKRVQRKQGTIIFLYLDVNDFKKVNTRFGHISGDLVLTEVGAILKSCVRGSDYVIRMGGDEFLAVLVDTDGPGAETVKGRINEGADKWNENSPLKGFTLRLSIGIQLFDGSKSFDDALAEADAKMYAEKQGASGRNAS